MANTKKKVLIMAMITVLMALLTIQVSAVDRHDKEPSQHYYVKASKNANVYASDRKTVILTIGKGDFFTVFNIDEGNKWTEVLLSGNSGDGGLAYISTKNLAHNENGKISAITCFTGYPLMKANTENPEKSCYIYAEPDKNSKKIGIMRRKLVYEVYTGETKYDHNADSDDRLFSYEGYVPIRTFDGFGWALTDKVEIGIEES